MLRLKVFVQYVLNFLQNTLNYSFHFNFLRCLRNWVVSFYFVYVICNFIDSFREFYSYNKINKNVVLQSLNGKQLKRNKSNTGSELRLLIPVLLCFNTESMIILHLYERLQNLTWQSERILRRHHMLESPVKETLLFWD